MRKLQYEVDQTRSETGRRPISARHFVPFGATRPVRPGEEHGYDRDRSHAPSVLRCTVGAAVLGLVNTNYVRIHG